MLAHRWMQNFSAGFSHVAVIISSSQVSGGATLSICKGDAICYSLFLVVAVVLIIRFRSTMAGDFGNFVNMLICIYDFLGKEGAPQGFILLDYLLLFDF